MRLVSPRAQGMSGMTVMRLVSPMTPGSELITCEMSHMTALQLI